jgi:hypothetical protein
VTRRAGLRRIGIVLLLIGLGVLLAGLVGVSFTVIGGAGPDYRGGPTPVATTVVFIVGLAGLGLGTLTAIVGLVMAAWNPRQARS